MRCQQPAKRHVRDWNGLTSLLALEEQESALTLVLLRLRDCPREPMPLQPQQLLMLQQRAMKVEVKHVVVAATLAGSGTLQVLLKRLIGPRSYHVHPHSQPGPPQFPHQRAR